MIDALLPLALALQAAPPAKTVNDAELGPAEQFTTAGPATVCLRNLVVRVAEGETVQLAYSGIHHASLMLTRSNGEVIELTEGEILTDGRKRGQRAEWRQTGMALYRVDGLEGVEYQIEGQASADRWAKAPRAFIRGNGLHGDDSDRMLLRGLSFETADAAQCNRRYDYGWEVLLGDAPLDTRSEPATENREN